MDFLLNFLDFIPNIPALGNHKEEVILGIGLAKLVLGAFFFRDHRRKGQLRELLNDLPDSNQGLLNHAIKIGLNGAAKEITKLVKR